MTVPLSLYYPEFTSSPWWLQLASSKLLFKSSEVSYIHMHIVICLRLLAAFLPMSVRQNDSSDFYLAVQLFV